MDGRELLELVELRWDALQELLEISNQQNDAIQAGHMTELMQLLSRKQKPLNHLLELADKIGAAVGDDPEARIWDAQSSRDRCRKLQGECEQMHLELLAIEAESESALVESRNHIQGELQRVDAAHQAANSYSRSMDTQTGAQLDLSSD